MGLDLQRLQLRLLQPGVSAAELDQAIAACRRALEVLPPQDEGRGAVLSMLGTALRSRFQLTGALPDIDAAVEAGEQPVTPPGHPNRAAVLSNLSTSLLVRYQATGQPADLDRAEETGEQALDAARLDDPQRPGILSNLSAVLKTKFTRADSPAAGLDRAIEVCEQALAATPSGHPARPTILTNLGTALRTRAERTGSRADMDRAVSIGEQSVAARPGHPDLSLFLTNLAAALMLRFERAGTLDDLDRAITITEQAIGAAPGNSPTRATALSNLGLALRDRYHRSGARADLDRAVEVSEQALAATAPDRPDLGRPLGALGLALLERYELTGTMADLDRAVEVTEQAVAATAPGDGNESMLRSVLGVVLRTRFERTGVPADLDRAIELGEQSVACGPPDPPRRAICLSNLGGALRMRFEYAGTAADLDRAIDVCEQALAATPPGDAFRTVIMSNLGIHLASRFERAGRLDDLDRAITADEEALAQTPPGAVEYPRRLGNLGADLHARFELTGSRADLDRAIEVGEQAASARTAGHQERAGTLTNLGIALRSRFESAGTAADLDRAIEVEEEAVACTAPDDPDRASFLCNLGFARWTRFKLSGSAADRDRGIAAGREGAAVATAPPADRQRSARLWADFAADTENWDVAAAGYAAAAALMAQVASRGLGRADQEYWLGKLSGLAQRAAAACLQAGQPERAVELWEQSRGIMLSQALDTRTDLSLLEDRHPDLADEFRRLSAALDQVQAPSPAMGLPGADLADLADVGRAIGHRRELAGQFDRVVTQIRSQPGFDRFLLPMPTSALLTAASAGPVVLINYSRIRSDAMILTTAGIQVVALPGLTPRAVQDQAGAFVAALDRTQDPGRDADDGEQAERRLGEVLGWLWDVVAEPVLDHLGMTAPPAAGARWPRLWWCPSGLLALLPLHAAGHHATPSGGSPRTVVDRLVSSYTPTVRALIHARRPFPPGPPGGDPLLVVAMPHTADADDLPGVADEAAMLAGLIQGTRVLSGAHARRADVSDALRGPGGHISPATP